MSSSHQQWWQLEGRYRDLVWGRVTALYASELRHSAAAAVAIDTSHRVPCSANWPPFPGKRWRGPGHTAAAAESNTGNSVLSGAARQSGRRQAACASNQRPTSRRGVAGRQRSMKSDRMMEQKSRRIRNQTMPAHLSLISQVLCLLTQYASAWWRQYWETQETRVHDATSGSYSLSSEQCTDHRVLRASVVGAMGTNPRDRSFKCNGLTYLLHSLHRDRASREARGAEFCDERVCLSLCVCVSAIISSGLHVRSWPHFCACYFLWPWLGPPLAA